MKPRVAFDVGTCGIFWRTWGIGFAYPIISFQKGLVCARFDTSINYVEREKFNSFIVLVFGFGFGLSKLKQTFTQLT